MEDCGAIIVEHAVADVEGAVRHVLQYGQEAEVLDLEELRDEVATGLRALSEKVPEA